METIISICIVATAATVLGIITLRARRQAAPVRTRK